MFALVSAAGTNRERVPDTQGLPKPCISPRAGHTRLRGRLWVEVALPHVWELWLVLQEPAGLGDGQGLARRYLFLLQYLLSHQLFPSFLAGGCSAPPWLHPQGSHPTPSSQGLPRLIRTSPEERNEGREGTGEGSAPVRAAADISPRAHLAGDVTWRLGRGQNLFPAAVQGRGLSLRDVHCHRGHRFPGETTRAASPSPPSTHTLARTGCWGGGTGGLQPLYLQFSPNQKQVFAEILPGLPGRAVTGR